LPRNGWTESIGMGGRLRPELPAGITRNTHPTCPGHPPGRSSPLKQRDFTSD